MRRRKFLRWGALLGVPSFLYAKIPYYKRMSFSEVYLYIEAVQAHMFPKESQLPSSAEMAMTPFLFETIAHPSYYRDIRIFVIEGAEKLAKRENGKFVTYLAEERERALRRYEKTAYGKRWLSRILILSMEALLSDPVYGSNRQEKGWRALHVEGGNPRPAQRYLLR